MAMVADTAELFLEYPTLDPLFPHPRPPKTESLYKSAPRVVKLRIPGRDCAAIEHTDSASSFIQTLLMIVLSRELDRATPSHTHEGTEGQLHGHSHWLAS